MKKLIWALMFIFAFVGIAWATVSTTSSRIQYNCDGATVAYIYDFKIYEDNDIDVVTADSSLSEATLILNTDYTVSGAGDTGGGTVTLTSGETCASNYTITLLRNIDITQDTDFTDGSTLTAAGIEAPPDKSRIIDQEIKEQLDRAIGVPRSSTLTGLVAPVSASRAIGWDSSGTGLTTYATNAVTSTDFDTLAGNHGNSIATAITDIGAGSQALFCDAATTVSTNQTLPSNINFIALKGCIITVDAGVSLTINSFEAGIYPTFNTISGIDFGDSAVDRIYPQWWGAVGDAVTDDTTAFTGAEASIPANGGTIFVPEGSYVKGRTVPQTNTTFEFDAGAKMIQKTAASNIWRIQGVDNVHFYGNGCEFDGSTSGATSAVFQFANATNSSIRDVRITSSAATEDGIYIGGAGVGEYSENILVKGCVIDGSKRNGISVVDARHVIIDGNEIKNVTGSPGAGIDVEANDYDQAQDIIIINNNLHDNAGYGMLAVFGERVRIRDNTVYDNGAGGIAVSSGGAQFDSGVYRARDRRGVSNFNVANGEITVSDGSAKGVDGMPIGTIISFNTTGGGAVPAELQAYTRWIVTYVDSVSDNLIRVGQAIDYDEQTSFSDAGSGTLDLDPEVSEVDMLSYMEGQASDIIIEGNMVKNNGGTRQIFISIGSINVKVINNFVYPNAGDVGISVAYAMDIVLENNKIFYDRDNAGNDAGISASVSTNVIMRGNEVYYAGGYGVRVSVLSHALIDSNFYYGCSHNLNTYCVRVDTSPYLRLRNNLIRTDDMTGESHGILTDSNSTDMLVEGNICKGVGTSNATSILLGGARSISINNVLWDGSRSVEEFTTLANDATPTVKSVSKVLTGGTTTITDFDDGIEGQIITITSQHAVTITDGTNIFLSGSANFVMAVTDTLTLICKADLKWYELSRSDNT